MDFNIYANTISLVLTIFAVYICTVLTLTTALISKNTKSPCYVFKAGLGIGILAVVIKCWTVLSW